MKKCALVLALLLGFGFTAPQAQALAIDVTYSLSGTMSLPVIGVIGTTGGNVTIRYQVSGGGYPASATFGVGPIPGLNTLHGSAHGRGGLFSASINVPSIPSIAPGITGLLAGGIPQSAGGTLLSGGTLALASVNGIMTGLLHCLATPAHCAALSPPLSASVPTPVSMPFHLVMTFAGATAGGLLVPTLTATGIPLGTMAGLPLTATITMNEVGRHVVPEPTSLSLAGLGLLGLAAAGWRVRRSRRR